MRRRWIGLFLALACSLPLGCTATDPVRDPPHPVSRFLESGDHRIALAILVEFSPSHSYGTWTVRGVAKRLLNYVA